MPNNKLIYQSHKPLKLIGLFFKTRAHIMFFIVFVVFIYLLSVRKGLGHLGNVLVCIAFSSLAALPLLVLFLLHALSQSFV